MSKFAIVIPAYNEVNTIRDVVTRAMRFCDLVIVVDDGSTDGTSGQLDGTGAIVLRNEQNLGKAGSMWRGMQFALSRHKKSSINYYRFQAPRKRSNSQKAVPCQPVR